MRGTGQWTSGPESRGPSWDPPRKKKIVDIDISVFHSISILSISFDIFSITNFKWGAEETSWNLNKIFTDLPSNVFLSSLCFTQFIHLWCMRTLKFPWIFTVPYTIRSSTVPEETRLRELKYLYEWIDVVRNRFQKWLKVEFMRMCTSSGGNFSEVKWRR